MGTAPNKCSHPSGCPIPCVGLAVLRAFRGAKAGSRSQDWDILNTKGFSRREAGARMESRPDTVSVSGQGRHGPAHIAFACARGGKTRGFVHKCGCLCRNPLLQIALARDHESHRRGGLPLAVLRARDCADPCEHGRRKPMPLRCEHRRCFRRT